ncbi:MAG TPA: hypothetical protein VFT19_09980 [Solirubrobacterales bacterium]|nr:hypothetical protein [Solirubrobacterales bacterium]
MRSGHAAVLIAIAALAPALPACGEDERATAGGGAATTSAAPAGVQGAAPANSAEPASTAAATKRCRRTLGEFLDAIESLANAVAVGLDYERYLAAVDGVRETYAATDAERLGLVCLARVAGPAEASLNLYIDAANEWGGCLAESSCEFGAIEAQVQRRWQQASTRLAQARRGLRSVN